MDEVYYIDFRKIFKGLLKHKRLYLIVLPVAFVLAAAYTLCLPNYYRCTVKLAPEVGRTSSGSLSTLASRFGVNLGSNGGSSTDALIPTLYPDLMNSVDFKTSLFPVPVTIEGNKKKDEPSRTLTYYEYLRDCQQYPWWTRASIRARKGLSRLLGRERPLGSPDADPFRLTREQARIMRAINQHVVCDVDKKTMVISIIVQDQNPLICATMADSVKTRLQAFITDYRTSKARVDLAYNQKIYEETKARYEEASRRYSNFVDANRDILLQSVRQRQNDLLNEMQLQYNAYSQVAAQVLAAEAKVQEETPAFVTLQSATVPTRKAGPSRSRMCLVFVFLAFLGTTAWIIHKEGGFKFLFSVAE